VWSRWCNRQLEDLKRPRSRFVLLRRNATPLATVGRRSNPAQGQILKDEKGQ
jgi:hypothetical protein